MYEARFKRGGEAGPRLILLHEDDTVLVCATPVQPGDTLRIDGGEVLATTAVDMGHKVARCALTQGCKIVKHGVAIGSATREVHAGEHVHLHNMCSDYMSSNASQAERGEAT